MILGNFICYQTYIPGSQRLHVYFYKMVDKIIIPEITEKMQWGEQNIGSKRA
ncbi:MAG: hypothetical protein SCAL_000170 [Candidatus Syntrophoarchaeum caldarius]|uniref:Uncharacterized protein n=1 Tax=Candidatus Syntropharchaeum caldarium TaxID=1838285 RepID=A0A1F2PBU5_9EURY|nr:MAG: hypothetical protein SCAL_000170 [Candidatus Syntrophoarchaeum caldarius]